MILLTHLFRVRLVADFLLYPSQALSVGSVLTPILTQPSLSKNPSFKAEHGSA